MNAVNGIFIALVLIFCGGYALDKIYVSVKTAAIKHIHRGQPSLGRFTNRLTCSKFTSSGDYVVTKCGRSKLRR